MNKWYLVGHFVLEVLESVCIVKGLVMKEDGGGVRSDERDNGK